MKYARKNAILYVMLAIGLSVIILFKYFPMYGVLIAIQRSGCGQGNLGQSLGGLGQFHLSVQLSGFL